MNHETKKLDDFGGEIIKEKRKPVACLIKNYFWVMIFEKYQKWNVWNLSVIFTQMKCEISVSRKKILGLSSRFDNLLRYDDEFKKFWG